VSDNYLDLYPEYLLPAQQRADYERDRRGAWSAGSWRPVRLQGRRRHSAQGHDLPRHLGFRRARHHRRPRRFDDHAPDGVPLGLPERDRAQAHARQADQVGVFVLGVDNPDNGAAISRDVDNVFKNSLAETLTETEQAFQLGFVAMSNQIIAAIRMVSFVVIVIIMAVMANAMAMSARERITEYATLKALGFGPGFIVGAGVRRIGRDRHGRRRSACCDAAGRDPVQAGRRRHLPGVQGVGRDHGAAGRVRGGGRRRGRARAGMQAARVRVVEGLRAIG
jgi:putative ABC transport system permease protein